MVCARRFITPAPSVLLPLTCEPLVYTKSLGSHFMLGDLVFGIVVVWCGWIGVGMSL
jgi:hypothetical protein